MYSEEIHTNITKIFENNIKNIVELYNLRLNKSRTDFMGQVLLALIASRSVHFNEIADKMDGKAEPESKLQQIQRFVADYDLDYHWIAYFIILLLPKQGRLKISIDRTEWEFGSQNHNILVVTAYTHGIGIPIWFEVLDNNGGNSCTDDRMYVMMELIAVLGKERIACIIGDCEFIGKEWVNWLISEGLTFFIDVRSNQYLHYKGKRYKIANLLAYGKTRSLKNVIIFEQRLNITVRKSPEKDKKVLAIVSNAPVSDTLNIYKLRWSIEVLFANLKKRGFNLEDTHLKDPLRIRKLFALVAIVFTLCFIVGLLAHQIKPITVKNHGYKANSFFRNGLNIIRKTMKKNNKIDFKPILKLLLKVIQDSVLVMKKLSCSIEKDMKSRKHNYYCQKIALFTLINCSLLCFHLMPTKAQNPENEAVFKRILSARFYHNHQWVLESTTLAEAVEVLKNIQPSYISGLVYLEASHSPNTAQIAAFKAVREALPVTQLDVVLNPNDYKKPGELLAKMKEIEAQLQPDIWYFDFKASSYKASAKHLTEAIAYAHAQGRRIGGNEPEKALLKEADFVAVYDGRTIDISLRQDIAKLLDNPQLTVLFQINNDSNRSTDDTVHTFMKKWKTYDRAEHIKRLARNQTSWKYRLMYPVFFPTFLNKQTYQAQQDGEMLKIFEELMAVHN